MKNYIDPKFQLMIEQINRSGMLNSIEKIYSLRHFYQTTLDKLEPLNTVLTNNYLSIERLYKEIEISNKILKSSYDAINTISMISNNVISDYKIRTSTLEFIDEIELIENQYLIEPSANLNNQINFIKSTLLSFLNTKQIATKQNLKSLLSILNSIFFAISLTYPNEKIALIAIYAFLQLLSNNIDSMEDE